MPYPPVTTEGSSRSFADTPQLIARPATLMPNRIRTTNSGVTMSPLLYLAVAGLVAIAITASFGGSSFRLMRANGTSAFSEVDQAHSPQSNFDPVPVARGAGVPPPSAAAGISDVSPAPSATMIDAALMPSRQVEKALFPSGRKSAPTAQIVPGPEEGAASPSAAARHTAIPLLTSGQGWALSQGTAQKASADVNDRPERDKGTAPWDQSHSPRSLSHKTGGLGSSGRFATYVTKKTTAVIQTLRPPASSAAGRLTQCISEKSAIQYSPTTARVASTLGAVP